MSKLRQLVKMQRAKVFYTDNGVAKHLFSLPRTATLIGITTQVVTGFDGTSTDLLSIGTSASAAYFVSNFDVSSAGYKMNTLLQGGTFEDLGLTGPVVDIFATYTDTNSNATEGEATVIAIYADLFTNPA